MKTAYVFPGQGSQSVGMLAELAGNYPIIQQTFAEASDVLNYDLWELTQKGSAEDLNQTTKTQPAMLTSGVAVARLWKEQGGFSANFCAGHSLGEYTALVITESLTFSEAVELVAERGLYMQEAVTAGEGAMAAILGLEDEKIKTACENVAQEQIVSTANFNSHGQVVIAGHTEAVKRAIREAKNMGAKRAIMLPVSVPSHCALMNVAEKRLAKHLDKIDIKMPNIPVIHNVDVMIQKNIADIHKVLREQLHQPVRWVETIQKIHAEGVSTILELGAGKVLTGLNKRIIKGINCLPVYDSKSLEKALAVK
jgi:[acyl-carrier-protein] S-malonyltransferase